MTQNFVQIKGDIAKAVFTGANESLGVDTQGNISDKDGASNGSETGAPAVFAQQLASALQGRNLSRKAPYGIDD